MIARSKLVQVLDWSRDRGFLGPGPVERHVEHGEGFAAAFESCAGYDPPSRFADMGTGGGIPGLVLATIWSDCEVVLIDSMVRRTSMLTEFAGYLGFGNRCTIVTGRVEELGRSVLRETFPLVTARSFASPPATAECGSSLVSVDGWLLVSEPPDQCAEREEQQERWPVASLQRLSLAPPKIVVSTHRFAGFRKIGGLTSQYPRRVGVPERRPLWASV